MRKRAVVGRFQALSQAWRYSGSVHCAWRPCDGIIGVHALKMRQDEADAYRGRVALAIATPRKVRAPGH